MRSLLSSQCRRCGSGEAKGICPFCEEEEDFIANEGWIRVSYELPRLNVGVEVKFRNNEVSTGKLIHSSNHFFWSVDCPHTLEVEAWRTIPEKCPDFRKLRDGDFIRIEYKNTDFFMVGYIVADTRDDDSFSIHPANKEKYSERCFTQFKEKIKKITRINIEEKTFEEI